MLIFACTSFFVERNLKLIELQRLRQEYDSFWQGAHRRGENHRFGWSVLRGRNNPWLRMHQQWPTDLEHWMALHGMY